MPLPFVAGITASRTVVLTGARDPRGRSTPGREEGTLVLAVAELGQEPTVLETFPGVVWEYVEWSGGIGRQRLAFSGSTAIAVGPPAVAVGFPGLYQVGVYSPEGRLRRVMRRAFEPIEVQPRDIEWLLERRLEEVEDENARRVVRQAYREVGHAERMPGFGVPSWPGGAEGGPDMLVDSEDNIWLFEYYRPGEYRNAWTLFAADGTWLGSVAFPDRFRPSQVGPDFVLGRWQDAQGLERVRRYRLLKP